MAKLATLTVSSLLQLLNLKGVYLLGYSFLLGMSIWVTFIGGVIAHQSLPRHQFGALQHRTFPVYFVLSIALSSGLLALWTFAHPEVLAHLTEPWLANVTQAFTLWTVVIVQASNHFIIGPETSKTMFARHKLEKEEGKSYNDEGVSDAMKALNSKFSQLHGWSSLANLAANIALIFHGLWIASHGLGKL